MRRICKLLLALAAAVFLAGNIALAAPTAEQRTEIRALGTALTKAAGLYTDNKFKEAGELLKDVQERLAKLTEGGDPQLISQVKDMHSRLVRAHALLELEGITLPEIKPLEAKPPAAKMPAGKGGVKGSLSAVSFTKDVAPILNARCGGCHVRNARGMFSMATYENLMKGPPAGKVVFPGNVPGSDLIVKVQDKEMPPSGGGIPDAELATLTKWVEEGAKFDGKDPAAQLTTFITATNQIAASPTLAVEQATGKETISFALDIAPIFVANCMGCHGRAQNPGGNLNMTTIAQMFRGGDRGEPVVPGKSADSLLIKKLKGTAEGSRMPRGKPPLDEATMVKIEKWISEGAKFDGSDGAQPMTEVAGIAKALKQTHEELSADRAKLAAENWRLGMPNTQPKKAESKNFFALGSVDEDTLREITQKAESLAPRVADVFKAPRDQPLIKGRMSLFVFSDRYDYGEFGKMVEKRDVPSAWRGHFRYSVIDAYGSVLAPKTSEYSLDALIAQQLGAVYVAAQGKKVPRWFAEGCGRVVATRFPTAGDQRIAAWDAELSGAMGSMAAPDDFLNNKLPPEQIDICSASFAKFLMSDLKRFHGLLDGMRKGTEFEKAFVAAYGGKPEQVAAAWARNPPKIGGGKKGK